MSYPSSSSSKTKLRHPGDFHRDKQQKNEAARPLLRALSDVDSEEQELEDASENITNSDIFAECEEGFENPGVSIHSYEGYSGTKVVRPGAGKTPSKTDSKSGRDSQRAKFNSDSKSGDSNPSNQIGVESDSRTDCYLFAPDTVTTTEEEAENTNSDSKPLESRSKSALYPSSKPLTKQQHLALEARVQASLQSQLDRLLNPQDPISDLVLQLIERKARMAAEAAADPEIMVNDADAWHQSRVEFREAKTALASLLGNRAKWSARFNEWGGGSNDDCFSYRVNKHNGCCFCVMMIILLQYIVTGYWDSLLTRSKLALTRDGDKTKEKQEYFKQKMDEMKNQKKGGAENTGLDADGKFTLANKSRPGAIQWHQVVGLEFEKQFFKEQISSSLAKWLNEANRGKKGVPEIKVSSMAKMQKGILMFGPPGTGKTYMSQAVADNIEGLNFGQFDSSDIQSKFIGESSRNMDKMFNAAARKIPSAIFLDEIENLFPTETAGGGVEGGGGDVTEQFLIHTDGTKKKDGVLVIGATNYPWRLPANILSRFTKHIYIGLPTADDIAELITQNLKVSYDNAKEQKKSKGSRGKIQLDFAVGGIDLLDVKTPALKELAIAMHKRRFANRDITNMCNSCKNAAVKNFQSSLTDKERKEGLEPPSVKEYTISMSIRDLKKCEKAVTPSLSFEMQEKYLQFNKTGKVDDNSNQSEEDQEKEKWKVKIASDRDIEDANVDDEEDDDSEKTMQQKAMGRMGR